MRHATRVDIQGSVELHENKALVQIGVAMEGFQGKGNI